MVESELGIMPLNWDIEHLEDFINSIKDSVKKGGSTERKPYVPIDMLPMNKMTFFNSRPGEDAKSSLISFKKGDILLGAMRVYFHRVCLAPYDGTTRTTSFVLRPKSEDYLYFSLLTIFQSEVIDFAESTSKGTTIPYAVWENGLGKFKLALPPVNILKSFNKVVKPLFHQMQALSKKNETLSKLRDTLLPKLLSGEIELPDTLEVIEDVPVS